MDVVLGVAVTGPVARLVLVGAGARGADVIDQSEVDLADNPIETLTETLVGTNRLLADQNHRLTATRLCWTDDPKADQLRRALEASGVTNVAVLSESQAVTALMRAAGRPGAALVVSDDTATLLGPAVGDEDAPPTLLASAPLAGGSGDQATAALDTLMARLSEQPNAPGDVYLVGASSDLNSVADQIRESSTVRVEVPDDPTFAVARGAAMAAVPGALLSAGDATAISPTAGLTGDETGFAPVARLTGDETAFAPGPEPAAADQQLAYSMSDEGEPLGTDEFGDEYEDVDDAEAVTSPLPLSRRSVLLGNAVIAFAVVGFASLAVAVTVAVRPTASAQAVVGHQNAAPGKFMPLLPTQQQAPVPPPSPDSPNAGFQGGVVPDSNGYIPPQLMSPGAGGTPPIAPVNPAPVAPGAPGVPGFMPNPNGPIPIPIIIPVPVLPPPFVPPVGPTTTTTPVTTTTPTTTTTPLTTTTTPHTTTTTPPTTTTPHTTTTANTPHVTTTQPTTQPLITPHTTVAPPPTTKPPTQQTIPTQPHTQQPITPQQPVTPKPPILIPHH
jgi:hypothetical protein